VIPPLAALLLFVAGAGLGALLAVVVAWHHWGSAFALERAEYARTCADVGRIIERLRRQLDKTDARMADLLRLAPSSNDERPAEKGTDAA